MCKKKTRKQKKEHKPDETLWDRDAENPHPRMSPRFNRPSPPIVWTFATPAFNRTVTRHDTVSFSIFRLLIRATVLEALQLDAAATVAATIQRTNEQGAALATFAAINTGLIPAAGINSRVRYANGYYHNDRGVIRIANTYIGNARQKSFDFCRRLVGRHSSLVCSPIWFQPIGKCFRREK